MCFPFDAIVPDLPPGFQVIAGGAAGERLHADAPPTAPSSPPTWPVPRARPASWSCPTSAACSASTRSSRSASPRPATRRSRSTTSAAPPAWARATRTSSSPARRAVHAGARRARRRGRDRRARAPRACVTVGFCFGGSMSFLQATEGHARLAGAVGFYGALWRERGVIDRAPDTKVPVLGLFGGDDESIPPDQIAGVRRGAAGRARDQGLRGRAALLLRPARRSSTPTSPRTRGNASWDSSQSSRARR